MTIKKVQEFLKDLFSRVAHPRIGAVIGMQEEIGKLSKNIMDIEIYGNSIDIKELENNCADVFFGIVDICNAYDVDLQKVSNKKLEIIKNKIDYWEKKHGEELRKKREKFDV